MDWSYIIFAFALILLIWILLRNRRRETPRLQTAIGIISEINDNIKVMEIRRTDPKSTKKFKTRGWKSYQDKLDFLDTETVKSLQESFTIIEDYNEKIEVATRSNSQDILQEISMDKLKEPLTKSKQGLVVWLKANLQTEMQSRRNLLGF